MKITGLAFLVLAAFLATGTATAQVDNIAVVIPSGSDGEAIAQEFGKSWNTGDFACNTSRSSSIYPVVTITCMKLACEGDRVVLGFDVTSGGGVTTAAHTINYTIDGTSGDIAQTIDIDALPSIALSPDDTGTLVAANGDTIGLTSVEVGGGGVGNSTANAVPALGSWTIPLFGGILAMGTFLAWRRAA